MKDSYKNILVPFDSSGSSMVAFEAATVISKSIEGSQITLLYVNEMHKNHLPANVSEISKSINKLKSDSGLECDFIIREGKVYKEIVKTANNLNSDLIVMGAHGISGFQEFFAGSNSYKVATTAPCPLITLKEHISQTNIHTIVLPIDHSKDTRQKVPYAAALAKLLGAVVHILVVSGNSSDEVNKLTSYGLQTEEFLQDEEVKTIFEVVKGNGIYKMVTDYSQKVSAGLIIIMTEQESESLFMGPSAQQMIHHSPFPVMSIKPKEISISYGGL